MNASHTKGWQRLEDDRRYREGARGEQGEVRRFRGYREDGRRDDFFIVTVTSATEDRKIRRAQVSKLLKQRRDETEETSDTSSSV